MKHKEKILQLRKEGKSYREIQKIVGCSKGTISYHLGAGQKEKTNQRTKSQRFKISQFISKYKEDSGCVDCGGRYPYFVLDLDHRNPNNKLFSVSSWKETTQDLEKVKAEISKCDVVCANCHRYRSQELFTSPGWGQNKKSKRQ